MQIAKLPTDEELRLQDLFQYNILDTYPEKEFDELVELAASICNCPVSMVTFVDEGRQWFKAKIGVDHSETSRDISFCAHAIVQDGVMVVEDSLLDERFENNPLTKGENPVRYYAGAPIISPTGYKLGTLCVINFIPKKLTQEQERALVILSNQITHLLELRSKNNTLRNRAEVIIQLKEQSVNQILQEHELQKISIAEQIQEQIAQEVAACKLYISIAGESDTMRHAYLKKANDLLTKVISDMCKISKLLSPAVVSNVPIEDLIADYISRINSEVPFNIQLLVKGNSVHYPMEVNLTLFRVIEIWINLLKDQIDVNNVLISLVFNGSIQLVIDTDSTQYALHEIENDVVRSTIDARLNKLQGNVSILINQSGGTSLQINLPVA